MQKLARCTGEDWLRDAITLFADDILAQGQFGSLEECQQHLRRMGALLDLLEEAGMKINLNKTEAMLTVHGRNQNLLQSQCVQRTANGYFLKIPRKQSISLIRLTSKGGYLGVQLTYGNPQTATLQRRFHAGQMAYKRLTFWLRRKRGLSTRYRLAIWRATVQSTLIYGTLIVGLNRSGLSRLVSTLTVMQRMILANHSFRTGQSHTDFFHEQQIEPPLAYIRRLCLALLRRQNLRLCSCTQNDILHCVDYEGPKMILDVMSTMDTVDRWLSPPTFSCPVCDLQYSNAAQLTKHLQATHAIHSRKPHLFRYDRDAAEGPPKCKHCHARFQCWTKLKQRITHGYCNAYSSGMQGETIHTDLQSHFRALSVPQALIELQNRPEWARWLTWHCVHCGCFQKCTELDSSTLLMNILRFRCLVLIKSINHG